jgi:predicted HAD superfamily Cof-like phosphohydrolase
MREKTAHQQRVEELMAGAGQHVPDRPTMPDEKTRELRARLILEETLETIRELGFYIETADGSSLDDMEDVTLHPSGKESLEGIADGCADVIVVTTGTLSACGIADDSLQHEVDINNLKKFEHVCPKCGPDGAPSYDLNVGNGWMFCGCCDAEWRSGYSNKHGKWVKPENHKPPDIAGVINQQTAFVETTTKEV